jgi:hypothetical protein
MMALKSTTEKYDELGLEVWTVAMLVVFIGKSVIQQSQISPFDNKFQDQQTTNLELIIMVSTSRNGLGNLPTDLGVD